MKKRVSYYSELAQIISAVAVVISLIYVGIQIRQNTLATKAAMRQSISDNDVTYLLSFLDNSIVAEANAKLTAGDTLSIKEKEQLIAQQHVNFRVFENAHYQNKNGLLENEVWQRYKIIIHLLLSHNETAMEHWQGNSFTYTSSFQNTIQEIMSDETLKEIVENRN